MPHKSELCEAMFEAATDGIAVHDVERATVEHANSSYSALLGRDHDDIVGRQLPDLVEAVAALDEPSVTTSIDTATANDTSLRRFCVPTEPEVGGNQLELTLECIRVDGEQRLVSRLRDLGDIGGGFERMAVHLTGLGVWQWEVESGAVEWNEQAEQMVGLEPGEFDGTFEAFANRVRDDELAALEERIEESLETGEMFTHELRMRHEDGSDRWVRTRGQPVTTPGGRRVVGTHTDITDRIEQEEEAEQLSTYLDIAMGGASPGVWEWDMGTDELLVNDKIESLLGMEPGAFQGTFQAFVDRTHPEDVETVQAAIQTAIENEEIYETEFRIEHEDGGYIWFAARGQLTTDDGHDQLVGIVTDITDRKTFERELAESNAELEQLTNQLEFFNSILRHDVLNGMTVIRMRAQVLADALDGEHAQYAETILEWCDTTTEVTERVREVIETLTAPEEDRQFEPVQLTSLLADGVGRLRDAYPEASFETELSPEVWVSADELLQDAVGNVLSNSIEHNDTEGLNVAVTLTAEDDVARVTIVDDGEGIAAERQEAVFRRGETSHAKESGSGFGLFYVDVMVESYGGDIWVEDAPGGGAMFVLELPLARQEGQA